MQSISVHHFSWAHNAKTKKGFVRTKLFIPPFSTFLFLQYARVFWLGTHLQMRARSFLLRANLVFTILLLFCYFYGNI
jgi:hypothetical protein